MASTIEINDAVFCSSHKQEVCKDCDNDSREENDAFFGFDPIDRDALHVPSVRQNEHNDYVCEKHGSAGCSQCFNWKKQLTRLRMAAKKAGK
ncbi:uncharacterized protein N7473_004416 [Penicillium subrubescens]|uniref:uncharacterized protein n=1 Tax=Penicillium subrubescens TaxID=1316194 RepID=UPI002544F8B2|nr:uncharacterized protein N7473_004416 [Penicillium subrubescens]KAJ5900346.1 hypothetical protein N7473_004416 [Penicillium subrubescens]